ncbi:MAG: hypothetical protein Q9160_008600 [Pyrenula sp. 1 TL-2023]
MLYATFCSLIIATLVSSVSSAIVDITYSAAGFASKPTNLARISYDAASLQSELFSWTPPDPTDKKFATSRLISIQVPDEGSTLTTLSAFNETQQQCLTLHLDASGHVYSAALFARDLQSVSPPVKSQRSSKSPTNLKPSTQITLLPPSPGPSATLNHRKPVKVDESGREIPGPEQEKEKTFLQKYWWVFLIVTVLALSGGGDK